MANKKKIALFLLFYFVASVCYSQTDTTFWFAAPTVTSQYENTPIVFTLSAYATTSVVVISEPANPAFQPYTVTIPAYSMSTVDMTSQLDRVENKPAASVLNYGIKISATANISAYYKVGIYKNPEIFPLKGKTALGLRFLIPSQTTLANSNLYSLAKSGFVVVATRDNTTVTISLSKADSLGAIAQHVILNRGQTYAVRAAGQSVLSHLGGSWITADKSVSVTIYDDALEANTICTGCACRDLIGDQLIPSVNTGSEFIIVRGALSIGAPAGDFYYVWATVDNTTVSVNGTVVTTINSGECYTAFLTTPNAYIVTTNPVYLYQMTGASCEMAATNLPSVTCSGSRLVSFVRPTIYDFQLNLICKASDIGYFLVNGKSGIILPSMFEAVPGTNGTWEAARINNMYLVNNVFPAGASSVVSNTNGLFHLGFVNGELSSGAVFGYFSDYSSRELSPVILSASTCAGTSIGLSANLIANATYQWTGPDNFSGSVYNPVINHASVQDSGTYYVTATIPGCGVSADSITVPVHALPTVSFVKSPDTVCYGNSRNINFTVMGKAPLTFTYTDGIQNNTISALSPGSVYFRVTPLNTRIYSIVLLTDSNGCVIDPSSISNNKDTLVVNTLPVADFSYSPFLCEKNAIDFTDNSSAGGDSISARYWDLGNGTVSNKMTADPFTETYTNLGNDTVRLAVQSGFGCRSDTAVKILTIHPLPKAGFIVPKICLNDAFALFKDTSKISDGSESQFTYQWGFDNSPTHVLPYTTPLPLSSTDAGPSVRYFKSDYYQVSLQVRSKDGCTDSLTQLFTVNGTNPHPFFVVLDSNHLCANRAVQIQNYSTVDFGNITKFDMFWDITGAPAADSIDANPLTGNLYTHSYPDFQQPSLKNYAIRVVAYSGNASTCSRDSLYIITLHQSPKVQFTVLPGICNDTTPRLIMQATETGNVPGTFAYYGTGVNSTGIYTPQSVSPGTYPVKYVYTSTTFGCSDSATQNQTVWPSPVAKWGVSSLDCEKNNILFTDSSVASYSNIVDWFWSFGDADNAVKTSAAAFTKQYEAANIYTASLRVMTDSGCRSAYNIQTIDVHYLPVVNFGLPGICLPDGKGLFTDSTTIGDGTQGLFTYVWNFGDANDPASSVTPNPIHRYSAPGPYTIQLKVTSKDGCTDSLTKQLTTVYPQPKADFNMNFNNICLGDQIQFTDLSSGITGAVSKWNWDLDNGNASALQNPIKQFTDSGIFHIVLYVYNEQNCVSDTVTKQVTVNPSPKLVLGPNLIVLSGGVITIHPQYYYGTNLQFLWTPSTYLNSDTASAPQSLPADDIQYKLIVTGIGNCSVTDSIYLTVLKNPVIPNIFTPNGDGINDKWVIKYLNQYPGCKVDVFSRYGQKVFHSDGYGTDWDGNYNGRPLPVGTYYYIINPNNGKNPLSGSVSILR